MYAVGRLGSYISRGVYTVSGPFHPFGGAVDIVVVEQPDGSFKSSPWYVRFGKFQGVLKTREKIVSICVNGIESDFHMFLNHKGEAYFLRDVGGEEGESESEGVSFPFRSGYDTDEPASGNRMPMKSKSCNFDAGKSNSAGELDVMNGKVLSRTTSRRSRIFGLVFGRRSMKENGYQEVVDGGGDVTRLDSLDRAEIAADLLDVKWSTNIKCEENKFQYALHDDEVNSSGHQTLLETQCCNEQRVSSRSGFENLEYSVEEASIQVSSVCNEQRFSSHSGLENLEYPVEEASIRVSSACNEQRVSSLSGLENLEYSVEEASIQVSSVCNEQRFSSHSGLENLEYPVEEASIRVSSACNEQRVSSLSGLENLEYSVEEASIQVSSVCTEQRIVETSSLSEGLIANVSGSIDDDHSVGNSGHDENETGSVSEMSDPDMQSQDNLQALMNKQFDEELLGNEEVVPNSPRSFVYSKSSESSVITSNGSSEQTHQTLVTTTATPEVTVLKQTEDMELDSEGALSISESCIDPLKLHSFNTTSTISESGDQVVRCFLESVDDSQNFIHGRDPERCVLPSESSEDEQFLFSDLDDFKLRDLESVNNNILPSTCIENEGNGSCNVNSESYLNDLDHAVEKSRIISNPIRISRNHRVAGENNGLQVESLPNMWSPDAKFDGNNHRLVSQSLDLNSETMKWTSIRKDDSSSIMLEANEEHPLEPERSSCEESGSGKLKTTLSNPGLVLSAEISLCKHLLFEGMGAEAACRVFDAEKLDSEKFSSLGSAVVKNDKLVVRIGGRYFPWDDAAPIILGMVTFGSEEIFEPKGMIPVDRVEKSVEGDPSKGIVSQSGSWRLWPFSLKRSRSRKTVQLVPADTRGLDGENTADVIAASDDDVKLLKPKQVKKMIRAITPTSEQLASLNLKGGINHITFTFSTPMLGNQQVDARIYLWKWNTRVVISDVDGTITKSDVLGQFMPLVGIDWSQTGVAHLFSAIKENGYQLLFLSARAISQAYITRQFLVNLKQDGKALPDGPIVISPDGLFPSLYREVIRRAPHEFKIACLEEIKALFPSDCNPFYAGFGNRDTDEISYVKVGIPKGKIFIINPKGEVAVNRRVDTKSYSSLHALVHGMFPPTTSSEQEDFNSWNFWKLPPPLMDI